jgi:ferrochelatase
MPTGVLLLNFGEPSEPDRDAVVQYLSLIFRANADLDDAPDPEVRARELAERRAPGLLAEYEEIGGSPLNAQARAQSERLHDRLLDRGHEVETFIGMQYTAPFVEDAVAAAAAEGIDDLIALPSYPLCGPSTTVLALEELQEALDEQVPGGRGGGGGGGDLDVRELTGWHTHPTYRELRADSVREFVDDCGVDLDEPDTALVFSAHGTPTHYLEAGSRYDQYVRDHCSAMGERLGVDDYHLGYQNHENRDIPWTEPEVEDLVEDLAAAGHERVVVDPISFVHEQSETLMELDVDLREAAEDAGLAFHRVPVPHDDPRLDRTFADLVEPFLGGADPAEAGFAQCECRDRPWTMCLNAPHTV